MAVQNEVRNFFSRFEPMDNAVIDYVTDHLQQHTENSMDLVDLRCMIEGFSGNFTILPDAERERLIKDLVEKVYSAAIPGKSFTTDDVPGLSLERLRVSTPRLDCPIQEGTAAYDAPASSSGQDVEFLRGLCPPGISVPFLQHVLKVKADGDMQAAAQWLLECGDLVREHQQWSMRREKILAEEEEQKRLLKANRKAVLSKYMLQPVPEASSKRGKGTVVVLPQQQENKPKNQQRYREGQLVATRGEKYIVEDLRKEWDGGSKGKVMTKGKRGKGFV